MNRKALSTLVGATALAISSLALVSFPQFVLAQPNAQKDSVERVRFKAAQQLYDKSDFSGALTLFQQVVDLNGSPNARLYVARCQRELGKLAEAYESLTMTMRDADALAAKEERYAATRDAAAAERAAIASKIALITVAMVNQPPGLELKIGGRTMDPDRLSRPIAVEPGTVVIEASAPNIEPFRKELTMAAGSSEAVPIAFNASPSTSAQPATPKTGGTLRLAGFGVLGLGVVGWATFAIAGATANSKYNKLYDECGGRNCTTSAQADEISTGRTLDTVANIGLGVGIAGTLGGAAMVIFGGPKEVPVSAGALPGGGWVTFQSRF